MVFQVAAMVECKACYGIENNPVRAGYAKEIYKSFKFWLNFFGKKCSAVKLIKGSFLSKNKSIPNILKVCLSDFFFAKNQLELTREFIFIKFY